MHDEEESGADRPEREPAARLDEAVEIHEGVPVSGELDPSEITAHIVERIEATYEYEHAGPLPSQHWFRAVEGLSAGCTDLILQDYKAQREHVREMEKQALAFDRHSLDVFAKYQTVQLTVAGVLASLLAVAGVLLIALDKPMTGFVLLVGEIGALVVAFFGNQRAAANRDKDGEDGSEG